MKKLLMMLLVLGMLMVCGCWSAPVVPLLFVGGGTVVALSISSDTELPAEREGGAWYMDPNVPTENKLSSYKKE